MKRGKKLFWLISWVLLSSFLVTVDQLESRVGEAVQITGFLYKQQDGRLILAPQPNLKSCCLGKESMIKQQIIVEGDVKETPYAITVEGILKLDPQKNNTGEYTQWYVLQQPHLVTEKQQSFPWKTLCLLGIGIGGLIVRLKRKRMKTIRPK